MRWRQLAAIFCGVLGAGVLGGCSEYRGPADTGTLRQDPAVLPLSAGTESPPAQPSPHVAKPDAGAAAKGSAEPAGAVLDSQLALARLCERRGEGEQAERIYRALAQKVPQDPRPHHRLGVLAVQKNDFARAEEQFRTACTLAPPNADLLSDIGYSYYLQQRLKEAEEPLNQALRLEPNHAAAINNLALVVGAEGRFDESLTLFKRANSEAKAYANLAYVLAQRGELARSQEMYVRALTLDNKMRAAAQAAVQIADRRRAQTSIAAATPPPQPGPPPMGAVQREPAPGFPPQGIDPGVQANASPLVTASLPAPFAAPGGDRYGPPR